uniref:Protein-S-isoprenylcysteine O-methyltransferase n=1 Tax=Peronospora matthiolae TaxID=2874970 RepID=A0AAV1TJ67_9STRA
MFQSEAFCSDRGLGKVALAALALGVFMTSHVSLLLYADFVALPDPSIGPTAGLRWRCLEQWGFYALALGFFHLMEFLLTAAYRPTKVSYESFLLNHSREYHLALLLSCLEFWLELCFVPGWKLHPLVRPVGLTLVVIGQFFRMAAMSTAANNFSHRIEYFKRKEHELVTNGVYRFIRHPSYLGWFWWIVGSQILLANPICAVGYTVVAWSFFHDRIPYEERLLLGFFPDEYPAYKARTFSGIPFVGESAVHCCKVS